MRRLSLFRPTSLLCLLLCAGLWLTGCQPTSPTPEPSSAQNYATDTTIPSRGTRIPVTLTTPPGAGQAPLVVMLHGHGGSRHEAGGFTQVANGLAAAGVASIRMDFPGCGDSIEPFRSQRLSTMLADAASAREWAIANASIDTNRMALFGFSMGGRLAITMASTDPRFQTMALWAPSSDDGATALFDFFGGEEAFQTMKTRAASEGFAPFTTSWGASQELSAGWFTDMASSRPLNLIRDFHGDLFVLYGAEDSVVTPAESKRVVSHAAHALSASTYSVAGADHGLGLFSDEPHLTREAVAQTVEFLTAKLTSPAR